MRSRDTIVRTDALVLLACSLAAMVYFVWSISRFFPNIHGTLGHDFSAYMPWLVAGYFSQDVNGVLSIPEFAPSFCGGIPLVFNPQSVFFSMPQLLLLALDPVASILATAIFFGLCGWLGMYALLRRVFATSAPAAIVGATLFLLNGFFSARMIVGHLTFHGFMLAPAITLALMPTSSGELGRTEIVSRAIVTGLLLAYIHYSGGIYVLFTIPLMVAIIVLVGVLLGCWRRSIPVIAFAGVAIAAGLCAYRLVPTLAYSANVPRPPALQLVDSLYILLEAIFANLFAPEVVYAPRWFGRHELAYGVGAVPLLLMFAAAVCLLRRYRAAAVLDAAARRPFAVVLLLAALILPVLLTYDRFGMRWLLTHLPITKSMSVMLRIISVYIPFLCVLSAVLLDFVAPSPRARTACCAAAVGLILLQWGLTDMRTYRDQFYDPAPVTAAYDQVRAGAAVPAIDRIEIAGQTSSFADGGSDAPCYDPMFGYFAENFRQGRLHPGPVTQIVGGFFNMKNPVCYVFPAANDCRPGDEFRASQADALDRFRHYRPFEYRWPWWQTAAAWVSLGTGLACLLALLGSLLLRLAGRRRVMAT